MNQQISNAIAQHLSYSYRSSTAESNKTRKLIDKFTTKIVKELSVLLTDLSEGEIAALTNGNFNTPNLKAIKTLIDDQAKEIKKEVESNWQLAGIALITYETGYITKLIGKVSKVKETTINAGRLLNNIMNKPINNKEANALINAITDSLSDKALLTIRQGLYNGLSVSEIITQIRGTKRLNYTDSVFITDKNHAEQIIRTLRTFLINQTYLENYKKWGIKKVIVVAVIDGRTSKYCAIHDGTIYLIDEPFPIPPYHYGCRTIILPYFGDQDKSITTGSFESLFDSQDQHFQKEWLGPTRFKLYKEGGYTLGRFVDPMNGKEYTLAQLKELDSKTFEQIFG